MKLIKTSVLPVAAILLLAYLGKYIYNVDGHIDWLRFCLVFGIPFGIPYMLFVVPIGGNPTTSVVILTLNVIVGAVFGCLIAVFALVRAVCFFLWWVVNPGNRRAERKTENKL